MIRWPEPFVKFVANLDNRMGKPIQKLCEWLSKRLNNLAFWLARKLNHTESICRRCKGPNVDWCAPSPLWNQVMRGGSINGPWRYSEIICPACFIQLAKKQGVATGWRVYASEVLVPLETTTPTGRRWNEETWLWE